MPTNVRGQVRLYSVQDAPSSTSQLQSPEGKVITSLPGVWTPRSDWKTNTLLYDWTGLVCELLRGAPDGKPYKLAGMYIEFENNGGAAVTTPAYDRSGGADYYAGLSVSSTRDYLRVPLLAIVSDNSDDTTFPYDNRLTCFAQTTGSVGEHGKTFSSAVSSRVYGGALVAFPDESDSSQDRILSRFYFESSNQFVKAVGSQIGISWPVTFE